MNKLVHSGIAEGGILTEDYFWNEAHRNLLPARFRISNNNGRRQRQAGRR
jgi:hypothetical protein